MPQKEATEFLYTSNKIVMVLRNISRKRALYVLELKEEQLILLQHEIHKTSDVLTSCRSNSNFC